MLSLTRIFAAGLCAGACLLAQENVAQNRLAVEAQVKIMAEQVGMIGTRVLSAEFGVEAKMVKGSPYSAQATTEMTQTLADGNRIVNRTTSFIARDGAGRTRREQSLKMLGQGSSSEKSASIVIINDPDTDVSYVLDANTHTARKNSLARAGAVMRLQRPDVQSQDHGIIRAEKLAAEQASLTTESLGSKMIEGLNAEGNRITHTIPAGQIGNDKPIQIVDETWTSPDLNVIVMSKHSDPRMGDTVYTLTNIQRAEPDPALFTVPSDYTITDNAVPDKTQFFYNPKVKQ